MSGYVQAIIKDAKQLGFAFDGFDGDGHIRLRNEQAGVRYSVPANSRRRKKLPKRPVGHGAAGR